ncbi:hypothetical protein J6590_067777 [Homalodisca vitripennis]|nr:hypothetical protein J6590_067777 [Homalodisca vitripennis]
MCYSYLSISMDVQKRHITDYNFGDIRAQGQIDSSSLLRKMTLVVGGTSLVLKIGARLDMSQAISASFYCIGWNRGRLSFFQGVITEVYPAFFPHATSQSTGGGSKCKGSFSTKCNVRFLSYLC